jgi:hypothetical protein
MGAWRQWRTYCPNTPLKSREKDKKNEENDEENSEERVKINLGEELSPS